MSLAIMQIRNSKPHPLILGERKNPVVLIQMPRRRLLQPLSIGNYSVKVRLVLILDSSRLVQKSTSAVEPSLRISS